MILLTYFFSDLQPPATQARPVRWWRGLGGGGGWSPDADAGVPKRGCVTPGIDRVHSNRVGTVDTQPPSSKQSPGKFALFAVISVSTTWKDCYPLGQFYRGFPNGPTLQQGQIWGQYSYHSHSPFIQDRRVAGIFAPLTFMHHLNAELPFGVLTFHSGRLQAIKY